MINVRIYQVLSYQNAHINKIFPIFVEIKLLIRVVFQLFSSNFLNKSYGKRKYRIIR